MLELVATPGSAEANTYLSLDDADEAMDGYPHAKRWQSLDKATRQRALQEGTRLIDRFKNWTPATTTQALAFPAIKDPAGTIRKEVVNSLLEFLDFKASGEMVSLKRLQAEGVSSRSILGQSSTMKGDQSLLPAGSRGYLEKLWRMYGAPVIVQRSHSEMFKPGRSTGSVFDGDNVETAGGNGTLSEI